jgi:hypothetical protein
MTPLDEGSACRRDLYLATHNTHKRQTSMPPVGFEPTIPANAWPQTYALDRVATGEACKSKTKHSVVLRLMYLYFMYQQSTPQEVDSFQVREIVHVSDRNHHHTRRRRYRQQCVVGVVTRLRAGERRNGGSISDKNDKFLSSPRFPD